MGAPGVSPSCLGVIQRAIYEAGGRFFFVCNCLVEPRDSLFDTIANNGFFERHFTSTFLCLTSLG
jgi:hypothetical protein